MLRKSANACIPSGIRLFARCTPGLRSGRRSSGWLVLVASAAILFAIVYHRSGSLGTGLADEVLTRGFVTFAPHMTKPSARCFESKPGSVKDMRDAPGATAAASASNLAKNIIGAGVLALPSGAGHVVAGAQAAGVDLHTASGALVVFFAICGCLNAYGFYLVGEVCARTGAQTYQQAWSKTLGPSLAWVPAVASLICCFTGTVASASVLGDTAADLVGTLVGSPLAPAGHDALLCGIMSLVVLPLCSLPSLALLACASVVGLAGVCLLALVMVVRCFDGSYAPGGELYEAATYKPANLSPQSGEEVDSAASVSNVCLFVALLSNAFAAHFNAPTIYKELQAPDGGGEDDKLESFGSITSTAFGAASMFFLVVTFAGLQTFGLAAQPLILNNYAGSDPLALLARVGLGLCVLFELPLLERCFRNTAVELLGFSSSAAGHPAVVAASVALTTAVACVPGLGLGTVSALGGALGASLLTYVSPALMALRLRELEATTDDVEVARSDLATSAAASPARLVSPASPATSARYYPVFLEQANVLAPPRLAETILLRGLVGFGTALGGLGAAMAVGLGP